MLQRKITAPLSRKATLVAVVISQWTARKLDKKITKEVNESHGAAEDAGRYNKLLIEAERLAKINGFVSQARHLHYKYTKPWCDVEGLRILPNVMHEKFGSEFRPIKRGFDAEADIFAENFPDYVRERKRSLNGLFDPKDYPKPSEIREKFKLELRTLPVPEVGDFRSDVLDEQTVEDIRGELADMSERAIDGVMKDNADQIVKVVGHMAEKLKTYKTAKGKGEKGKATFFTSALVDNVRELAELLPAFNLNNDPTFDALIERINRELCAEDSDALRDNDKLRKVVAKSADDILKDVSALLG